MHIPSLVACDAFLHQSHKLNVRCSELLEGCIWLAQSCELNEAGRMSAMNCLGNDSFPSALVVLQEWSVSLFSLLHYPFFHLFLNSKPGSITFCLRISWWALKIMVWPGPTKENQPQIFTFTASCFTAGRRLFWQCAVITFHHTQQFRTWQKSSILYRLMPELLSPRCFEKAPISRQSRSRCDCSPFCYIFTSQMMGKAL